MLERKCSSSSSSSSSSAQFCAGRAKANCSSLRRESLKVIIAIIVNVGVVFIVLIVFIIVPSTVIIICVATIINTEVKWVFLMALVMVMIKRMMGKTMES